jgi:centromere protein S
MPSAAAHPDVDPAVLKDKLKSALWFHIGKIVDEETLKLGVNATPHFIGSLVELVWTQIESAAIDLESFAGHANRSTIKTDDVLLLARRNEGLDEILRNEVKKLKKTDAKGKAREGD